MEENDEETLRRQVIYENPGTLTQVQHLSQIVWDLLMFLPTNSSIREKLETFGGSKVVIRYVTLCLMFKIHRQPIQT